MKTRTVILTFAIPLKVPVDLQVSEDDKAAMTERAAEFILWELNELVRKKTGAIQFCGVTALQAQHEGERDNAN